MNKQLRRTISVDLYDEYKEITTENIINNITNKITSRVPVGSMRDADEVVRELFKGGADLLRGGYQISAFGESYNYVALIGKKEVEDE